MPTFDQAASFWKDWTKLTPEQKKAFLALIPVSSDASAKVLVSSPVYG